MKTLRDFNFKGKRVLVRVDFNVPISERGKILDDFRIKVSLPTLKYLIKKGARIILISHLGRPEGKFLKKFSLKPVAQRLAKLLARKVKFLSDCQGEKIKKEVGKMRLGDIFLLENLRFYQQEEENDKNFSKNLSQLADIFINDAFSVCHRSHASVVGITKYLPSGAGFLLEKEIKVLTEFLKNPQKPLIAIVGGKKVETKSKVIDKISEKADWILINHLIKNEIGEKNLQLKYPQKIISPIDGIDKEGKYFDIGQKTIELFKEKIFQAKTIFWSGPLGMIEKEEFSQGSEEIAKAIIDSQAFSIVGGGETVEFINKIGLAEKFDHVSTGGGAMLEFLAGEKLPGIEALK